MKHSIAELIEIAHQYFPDGYWPEGHEASLEYRRRAEAHLEARKEYEVWRSVLRHLRERFPNVEVRNESIRFEAREVTPVDRCFAGTIELPPRKSIEQNHRLGFRVSFVVPYYFIYSTHQVTEPNDLDFRTTFDLTADEAPFAAAVEEEIRGAFPLHTSMTPEVGMTVIPNVATALRLPGEATIYDCLFSDSW